MPAMSPTMTQGNIASWKVKDGDSFSTGDVLLEIETDKAQMDVEAQDDGKMAKITQPDGAKGVKVGVRIAILAESDDDLSTLSLPDEAPQARAISQQEALKPGIDSSKSPEPQSKAPHSSKEDVAPMKATESLKSCSSSKPPKQTYPLYPSIAQILHERGLSLSEADKIPASGPKGRLLKGDVLAYLGQINKSYSSEQSARIAKLGHLELSNVKAAPAKEAKKPSPSKTTPTNPAGEQPNIEIAIPISLTSVISVQKRIQDTLGVTLPLSTFLARATELANEHLPRSSAAPTADEMFNDILGLNNVSKKASWGDYVPQITALPSRPMSKKEVTRRKEADVYDILTGQQTPPSVKRTFLPVTGISEGNEAGDPTSIFSISATKGEEKRAKVFLERMRTALQVEPGRLVL